MRNLLACAGVSLAVGVGVGRISNGDAPATTAAGEEQGAVTKISRERRSGERVISSTTSADDLMRMIRTGRADLALAKVTVTLEDQSPARLAELAAEMREISRKNPSFDWNQMQLQGAVMSAWAQADPQAAVDFVMQSPSRNFRTAAAGSVFRAIAQSDPEGAVAMAEAVSDPTDRRAALSAAVYGVSQRDPEKAIGMLSSLKGLSEEIKVEVIGELAKTDPVKAAEALSKVSPILRDQYYNSEGMFNTWAAGDPEAVLAWAEKTTDLNMRNSAMKAACRRLAVDDPQAALKRLESLPAHLKKDLMGAVFSTWADTDPKAALAAAAALKQPAEREQAMASMVSMMRYIRPDSGTEVVLAMPKGNVRADALRQLAWGMSWQSTADNLKLLEKFSGVERSQLSSTLAASLLSQDAEAAIRMFAAVPAGERDRWAFSNFSQALSMHDPARALEFAATLDSATERSQMVQQAFAQMAQNSPTDAAARLAGIKDTNERQQALTTLAESWGATDAKAAMSWANGLQGAERTAAVASLLPLLAADDPRGAGVKLQALLENPGDAPTSVLQKATSQLAGEWAGRDPQATAKWLQGLPGGNATESGTGALVMSWARHDAAAAGDWLATLPAGSTRDAGIAPLINTLRQTDPAAAFDWGLDIQDATKRATIMEQTIRNWDRSDSAAVKQALQAAQLDPAERATYEKLLK